MNLREAFERAASQGRAALITYIAAGDPTLDRTGQLVPAIAAAGADVIELGIPYSDPIADGPTIQEAGQRALAAGTTVRGVLDCARSVSGKIDAPLVIMTCYNPILAFGPEAFARAAAEAGVQGVLVSDLPVEESGEWTQIAAANGLATVFLVAPTTAPERRKAIAEACTGFVYVISRPGTTGAREDLPEGLDVLLEALRTETDTPLAVGFGISKPEHVQAVAQMADGAVVGSAIVEVIAKHGMSGSLLPMVQGLVSSLAEATKRS